MPPYKFKLSDSSVNDYGTRVLTDGISIDRFKLNPIMLWMHRRDDGGFFDNPAPLPIGRWENISKEGDDLFAEAVFDENDEFSMQIKDKIDQKIINAASPGFVIIDLSEDPAVMLPGQTRATISKSELVEASIVDIPGNKNSVRLYNKGTILKLSLNDVNTKIPEINFNNSNNMKKILLAGLAAFAAFFGKTTETEMEFSQDDAKKVNDELQSRADNIVTLTGELNTLKTANTALTTAKTKADSDLVAANSEITTLKTANTALTTENTDLKANPGAKTAASATAADPETGKEKIKLAANSDDFITNLENVKKEYM